MIIAKFSNGHADRYKGSRPVKAAWAIIRLVDGVTLASGHSLDRAKAAKTADGNLSLVGGLDIPGPHWLGRGAMTVAALTYYAGRARAVGWDGKSNAVSYLRAQNAANLAKRRAAVKIEIVDV